MTFDHLDDARSLMDRLDRALPPHTHVIDGEHDDDPLVQAARRLAATPPPALPPDAVDRIEARLHARLAELTPPARPQVAWHRAGGRLLRLAVAACLIFLIVGAFGTARAAADSLPGDALYPVKRAIESGRLALVPQGDEAGLRVEFAQRRVDEFRRLFAQGTVYPQALEEATDQIGRALRLVGTGEAEGDGLGAEIRHIIEQQADLASQAIPAAPPAAQLRLESVLDESARIRADVEPELAPAAPATMPPGPTLTVPPTLPPITASPTPSASPSATATPVPSATPTVTHTATATPTTTPVPSATPRRMTPTRRPLTDLAPAPFATPSRTPPGHGPTPGLGGSPPGQGGPHPGQGNNGVLPGQQDGAPDDSVRMPGQQPGAPPGNSGNAPGQQPGGAPGNSENAPGHQPGAAPGNSGNAPGQQGKTPGNSGGAPGQNKPDNPPD